MTTKNKTAKKVPAVKTPVLTAVELAVQAYFTSGASLDDTAQKLSSEGIGFSDIQSTIQSTGIKHDWILTDEKIKSKVQELVKDKTLSHFLDVVTLAKSLDIPQMSTAEKQQAIIDFSGVVKSVVAKSSKFKQLDNSGIHGAIANWIKENPDFTASELHSSGAIPDSTPKQKLYYDEFLSYREFFQSLAK